MAVKTTEGAAQATAGASQQANAPLNAVYCHGTMAELQKKWFGKSFDDMPVTFVPEF